MRRLLTFNCWNDMALASNANNYMPSASIVRMMHEMAELPLTWADDGDVVLVDSADDIPKWKEDRYALWSDGYKDVCRRFGCEFKPYPWGWSRAIKGKFSRFGIPESLLPTDEYLERLRMLSNREFAAKYIKQFLDTSKDPLLAGEKMVFAHSIDDTSALSADVIAKTPWSCSGRGIRIIHNLKPQDIPSSGILIDHYYTDKVLDFAAEFAITEREAHFIGWSVFLVNGNGKYGNNIHEPQHMLKQRIVDSGIALERLDNLINVHLSLLNSLLVGKYEGYAGIDMMSLSDGRIHPCIEINLRMNMGIVSICHTQGILA